MRCNIETQGIGTDVPENRRWLRWDLDFSVLPDGAMSPQLPPPGSVFHIRTSVQGARYLESHTCDGRLMTDRIGYRITARSRHGTVPIRPAKARRMAAHHRKVGSVEYQYFALPAELAFDTTAAIVDLPSGRDVRSAHDRLRRLPLRSNATDSGCRVGAGCCRKMALQSERQGQNRISGRAVLMARDHADQSRTGRRRVRDPPVDAQNAN